MTRHPLTESGPARRAPPSPRSPPISPIISPYLAPPSPRCPHISPYLPRSPATYHISRLHHRGVLISPHISPYLPLPPHISRLHHRSVPGRGCGPQTLLRLHATDEARVGEIARDCAALASPLLRRVARWAKGVPPVLDQVAPRNDALQVGGLTHGERESRIEPWLFDGATPDRRPRSRVRRSRSRSRPAARARWRGRTPPNH